MTEEKLFQAVGGIPDEMIEEADSYTFEKKPLSKFRLPQIAAVLAVVCLIGGGIWLGTRSMGRSNNHNAADPVGENGLEFQAYVGPVLPLTAEGNTEGISAERSVDYDFQDGKGTAAKITDRYLLTNSSGQEQTLSLLYPVLLSLGDAPDRLPAVSINGEAADTVWRCTDFDCFSYGTIQLNDGEDYPVLNEWSDWKSFAALFEAAGCASHTYAEGELPDLPLTVYRVRQENADAASAAPVAELSFFADPSKTTFLTYGMNGYHLKGDSGRYGVCSWLNEPRSSKCLLIVYGDDVSDILLEGYTDGSCEKKSEAPVNAVYEREETTLQALLPELLREWSINYRQGVRLSSLFFSAPEQLLTAMLSDLLCQYEPLLDSWHLNQYLGPAFLEDLFQKLFTGNIYYLAFSVTLPAGGSAEINCEMTRSASRNNICRHKKSDPPSDLLGYDMAAKLGSSLSFTSLEASLSGASRITMLDNNFGFDPAAGILQAKLDPAQDYYWMRLILTTDSGAEK